MVVFFICACIFSCGICACCCFGKDVATQPPAAYPAYAAQPVVQQIPTVQGTVVQAQEVPAQLVQAQAVTSSTSNKPSNTV